MLADGGRAHGGTHDRMDSIIAAAAAQSRTDAMSDYGRPRRHPPPLPPDPLLDSAHPLCRRIACRRAIIEGTRSTCGNATALKLLEPLNEDGDEAGLERVLRAYASSSWRSNVEPYFLAKYDAALKAAATHRIAVIMPGAVRTMFEPAHLAEFGAFFAEVRQNAYVHAFAYITATAEVGCWAEHCGHADAREKSKTA